MDESRRHRVIPRGDGQIVVGIGEEAWEDSSMNAPGRRIALKLLIGERERFRAVFVVKGAYPRGTRVLALCLSAETDAETVEAIKDAVFHLINSSLRSWFREYLKHSGSPNTSADVIYALDEFGKNILK